MDFTNYTVRDLVYYSGLFAGIIIVSQWMRAEFQTHQIINVVCGGIAGLGLATMATRWYDSMKAGAGSDGDFPKFDE